MIEQQQGLTSPDGITYRLVPIEWIIPNPENYNQHPLEQIEALKADFKRFGQVKPYVVKQKDEMTFMLSAGEGCTIAAGELLEEDPKKYAHLGTAKIVVVPDWWTDADVEGFMAADNETGRMSYPDETKFIRILQRQKEAGYDLHSLGADEETLRQMIAQMGEENPGHEDGAGEEDEPPDVEEEQTRVKTGDIWQLGRHHIGCLNSLDASEVKRLLSGNVPTFIFSDPPYGLEIVATNGYVGGGEAYDIPFGGVKNRKGDVGGTASHMRKTGMSYMESNTLRSSVGGSKRVGDKDITKRGTDGASHMVEAGKYFPVIGDDSTVTATAAYRLCAESFPLAIQIWWGANYYANALPPSQCWIVWDKENTGNFADAELAWCSDKSAVRIFKHMWNGMLKDSEHGQRRVHPTQKPIALAEWCFEKYGKDNDVVYDPFLGSGISVIAAERLERTAYGCELSPAYIDVIIRRWEKETNQQAHLLERAEVSS